ncbi:MULTISPECIES: hypothetical protein [Paenibacillus]|uniref:hypothetical protein n=1 Tax=Paenibacillus TaxID=44249 RepID=UPI001180F243|nr:hypothetical protein [Paenibacillus lautus]
MKKRLRLRRFISISFRECMSDCGSIRADECGGACWDYYTFLPGQKNVVSEPVSGGPETIYCGKQACSTYSIKNNRLTLNNGKSYSIRVSAKRKSVHRGYTANANYARRGESQAQRQLRV